MDKQEFVKQIHVDGNTYDVADITLLEKKGIADIEKLPFSIKILVENLLRKLDGQVVREKDLIKIANWQKRYEEPVEIPYHPARVLMQDFTGVPAVVDLAAMRDALKDLGGDPMKINPVVPVDLVIDHSVQVDQFGTADSLEKNVAMNQLLCGDVGSGKTIIAIIAAFTAWQNQLKTLVMAPTEILAKQHYDTFKKFLPEKIKIGLQTGAYKKNYQQADILIGTHALLFKKKLPENVGLVVIDEQHRFGVRQRSALIKADGPLFPHVLTMTATPIPRSVALVLHGNLDLSFLDQMPKNRKPVKTWLVPEKKRLSAYNWIKKQIRKNGAQVFIIYPLIEESKHETMKDVKAATAEYEKLKKTVFADFNLALIHGQIKSNKKNQIIKKFSLGKIDILVAISVVEVGLDIPGATIMVIEGANRFGLAQIHQLRGRIGRNNRQSYCLLFTPPRIGKKSYRRLKILEKTNLGIKLAKLDLEERGPGEIFGTTQHGFPEFKLASLADYQLVEKTKNWAKRLTKRKKMPNSLKKRLEEDKIGQVEPN